MIPLPFPIERKARPVKPTTEREQNGREENATEFEDLESEEDEVEAGQSQSALENISQRITELGKATMGGIPRL